MRTFIDFFGRNAGNYCVWLYVFCDNTASTDNGAFSNVDSRQDDSIAPYPDSVTNGNWTSSGRSATNIGISMVMSPRIDGHTR